MSLVEIDTRLWDRLEKLPRKVLISIMLEALDLMQQYNGRTITYCIAVAMGAEAKETESGGHTYHMPSRAKTIKLHS